MSSFRRPLPQLGDRLFITDGGIETTLIFHEGLELPHFAAFHLFQSAAGQAALRRYFERYVEVASRHGTGLLLEAATWRANPDWGKRLGYGPKALAERNRQAIRLLEEIRDESRSDTTPVVISGCIGPRGDGYVPGQRMTADQAQAYHEWQVHVFAGTQADMVTAITMNDPAEAIGIARAAEAVGLPVVLSFTVETDGRLPSGETLREAIEQVDDATAAYPAYFMINCAHPSHFDPALRGDAPWLRRIRGLRANASRLSHAELDEAPELDSGNPDELGEQHAELKRRMPWLTVFGGCCGTDHRHVDRIAAACQPVTA